VLRDGPGGPTAGIVVEVEAYAGPEDRASHSRAGRTRRTEPMYGPPGHAYVYLVYGLHSCLNVVSETDGMAGAVLVRALEPYLGIDDMRLRRRRPHDPEGRLCAGPARLCQALSIDRRLDGLDLTLARDLWIADPDAGTRSRIAAAGVVAGPRVGVDYAGPDWAGRQWRFGVQGHPGLSRPFARS
jgi:DNA-3-methyladenine glycosylase